MVGQKQLCICSSITSGEDPIYQPRGFGYPPILGIDPGFGSIACAYNYSSSAAKSTFETIASTSNSTIFYPNPAVNPLTSPLVLIPLALVGVYVIVVIVVFRRS